jgi:hypothetical protein
VTDKKKGVITPPGGMPLLSRIGQRMVYELLHSAVPPSEEVLQAVPRDVRRTYELMREAELLREAAAARAVVPHVGGVDLTAGEIERLDRAADHLRAHPNRTKRGKPRALSARDLHAEAGISREKARAYMAMRGLTKKVAGH